MIAEQKNCNVYITLLLTDVNNVSPFTCFVCTINDEYHYICYWSTLTDTGQAVKTSVCEID